MPNNDRLNLTILDNDIQVRVAGDQEKILRIEKYVNDELNKIRSKNQFANHIHIALLGCLNLAEKIFDLEDEMDDLKKAHSDELVYYKNIENKKDLEQNELNSQIRQKDLEIQKLNENHKQELRNLSNEHQTSLDVQKSDFDKRINEINEEKEKAIRLANSERDKAITELNQKYESQINNYNNDREVELNSLRDAFQREMNQIIDEKDAIINSLKEDNQAQLYQINQQKEAIVTRLRKERESELRQISKEKDTTIAQLNKDKKDLLETDQKIRAELDEKNELLNQYREKLKQTKDENDLNRKSIIDLQNQLFENQIELEKLKKNNLEEKEKVEEEINADKNLNDILYALKNHPSTED